MTDLATQGGDDLRSTLESAIATAKESSGVVDASIGKVTAKPDVIEAKVPVSGETVEQKAARERDEIGRFKAKAADGSDLNTDVKPDPKPAKVFPKAWKREVEAVWGKVDTGEPLTAAEVDLLRDEALRREGDFYNGIEKYKSGADAAAKFEQAYRPYEATIRQLGVTPDVAAAHLFSVDHKLRYSAPMEKAQMVAQLIQQYGIDPNHVFQNFQPKQAVDPAMKPVYDQMEELRRQNAELQQNWKVQTQTAQERELAGVNSEIAAFSQGKEHFAAVVNDMTAMLPIVRQEKPGATMQEMLQDAYERAIWARPDLRANLLSEQTRAAEQRARDAAQAQRSKAAAVSVKGSTPMSGSSATANGTVREALLAAMGTQ